MKFDLRPTTAVYRIFDGDDNLLYVGASERSLARVQEHASEKGWFSDVNRVSIERFETREEALSAEKRAIETERPRHNVQHNPFVSAVRHYEVDATCSNCGWEGVQRMLKGRPLRRARCPKCGCETLTRMPAITPDTKAAA